MPYVVTTRPGCDCGTRRLGAHVFGCSSFGRRQQAAATLEGARRAVYESHRAHDSTSGVHTRGLIRDAIGESGGTSFFPLPDGTVLTVAEVPWTDLYRVLAPFPADRPLTQWTDAQVVDAFNAVRGAG